MVSQIHLHPKSKITGLVPIMVNPDKAGRRPHTAPDSPPPPSGRSADKPLPRCRGPTKKRAARGQAHARRPSPGPRLPGCGVAIGPGLFPFDIVVPLLCGRPDGRSSPHPISFSCICERTLRQLAVGGKRPFFTPLGDRQLLSVCVLGWLENFFGPQYVRGVGFV
jgi:hypothetical protein